MRKEAEAHADEDRKQKERIEVHNAADSAVYTAEKVLRDLGDKVPAEMKTRVDDQVLKVRQVMEGEDVEVTRKETEALNQIISQIGAAAYQQTGPAESGADGGQAGPETPGPEPEDVVDGEFRNV